MIRANFLESTWWKVLFKLLFRVCREVDRERQRETQRRSVFSENTHTHTNISRHHSHGWTNVAPHLLFDAFNELPLPSLIMASDWQHFVDALTHNTSSYSYSILIRPKNTFGGKRYDASSAEREPHSDTDGDVRRTHTIVWHRLDGKCEKGANNNNNKCRQRKMNDSLKIKSHYGDSMSQVLFIYLLN